MVLTHLLAVGNQLRRSVVAAREKQVVDAVQVVTVLALCASTNKECFVGCQWILIGAIFVKVVIDLDVLSGAHRIIGLDLCDPLLFDLLLGQQCIRFPLLLVRVDGVRAIEHKELLW